MHVCTYRHLQAVAILGAYMDAVLCSKQNHPKDNDLTSLF